MPRSPVALSVLTVVLLLVTPARAEDVRAVIEAANAKVVSDYAAGDAKAIAMSYAEDAVTLLPDATRVAGRGAIEVGTKS